MRNDYDHRDLQSNQGYTQWFTTPDMTKVDYIAIANCLKRTRQRLQTEQVMSREAVIDMAAEELAAAFADSNVRFDRDRFIEATKVAG